MRAGPIRVVALVVLALVAIGGWRWWRSDERRIASEFERLLATAEKRGEETQIERFSRAREFVGRFADPFEVSAAPYEGTITDRQQLAAVFDQYRGGAERIDAAVSARELTVRGNGTADLYAVVTLTRGGLGGGGGERFRLRLSWIRQGDGWKIRQAEILERLESSGLLN
ncbi:MAG: nuclear transport factor 2 family protein [Thermoanaerobaculia bacterium]